MKGANKGRRQGLLSLRGLDAAPAQTWGAIRLVPLVRREVRDDLRLALRSYGEDVAIARLDGRPGGPGHGYMSFVPHGLVVSWSDDGSPVAAFGASLRKAGARNVSPSGSSGAPRDGVALGRVARVVHRMAKREADRRLRLLPLHLAMEGFLGLHFGGPEIAWESYSQRALRRGLLPRTETSIPGAAIAGMEDALRVFEIHEAQTGVMVFVADAFASVFVVPHPDDYRALHRTLLEDFFGELLYRYGLLYPDLPPARAAVDESHVRSLDDLRGALRRVRTDWANFAATLADGVVGRTILVEDVYRLGPFALERFSTSLDLNVENQIGERIVRDDGTVEYLKTFRLGAAQARRAYLLALLAAEGWSIMDTAEALGTTMEDIVKRLENAGFGYLLAPGVLEAARKK